MSVDAAYILLMNVVRGKLMQPASLHLASCSQIRVGHLFRSRIVSAAHRGNVYRAQRVIYYYLQRVEISDGAQWTRIGGTEIFKILCLRNSTR